MTWARKKDANHNAVMLAFQQHGWSVLETYRAPDCPDMFVSKQGRTIAIEVKSGAGKLNSSQSDFRDRWQGEYYLVRGPEAVAGIDALEVKQDAVLHRTSLH